MKYLFLLYGDEVSEVALTPEESRAIVEAHLRFRRGLGERGALVRGEPLSGRGAAFAVRPGTGGLRIATDGPFAETKEQLGSYYVVECEIGSRRLRRVRDLSKIDTADRRSHESEEEVST